MTPRRVPGMPPERPKRRQEHPRSAPRGAKSDPRGARNTSEGPRSAPGSHLRRQMAPGGSPGGFQEPFWKDVERIVEGFSSYCWLKVKG